MRKATKSAPEPLKFRVLLINREENAEHLAFQEQQLSALGLTFHRVDAYTPDALPDVRPSYWRKWRRPLKPSEKARLLSHGLAWDWVADNGPALILEDNAILARSMPDILRNLEVIDNMEMLSLEVRRRASMLGKLAIPIGHGVASHRVYLDRFGSSAYVLWPEGAKKLIARAAKGAVPLEGMAQWAPNVQCYQADPACAVQFEMAEKYGLNAPLTAPRSASKERMGSMISVPQTARLLRAQAHKLLRALRYCLVADRRRIDLRPEYFDV